MILNRFYRSRGIFTSLRTTRLSLVNIAARCEKEGDMVNELSQVLQAEDWNDIYIAALLEGDPDKVPFLIR